MPRRVSPLRRSGEPSRINGSIILASVFVSFALVAGVFVWIFAHPHKTFPPLHATNMAAFEPSTVLPAPPARTLSAISAIPHSGPREAISDKIPLVEVNPPPLPPPASTPKQPTGETYGTQVLFLNNRETASELARREHKLLFVMHISGNFEDSQS
jgi:hypothetical protein